jgi:hypothetical protein
VWVDELIAHATDAVPPRAFAEMDGCLICESEVFTSSMSADPPLGRRPDAISVENGEVNTPGTSVMGLIK